MATMLPTPQPAQKAPPAPQQAPSEGLSSDQQETLKKFSLACAKALYDKKGVAKKIARAIKSNPKPAQGLADFAYNLTTMLDEKSGGMIDDELLAVAAADVLGQIVEIAHAAGVPATGVVVAEAIQIMLRRFMEETGASPDEVDKVMQNATPEKVGQMIDGGLQ